MAAGLILAGAGAGISLLGSSKAKKAAKAEAARQAAVYEQNAKIAERNAKIARAQAHADATTLRRTSARTLGAIRAAYGASGIVGNQDSALWVAMDAAAEGEMDALNTVYKGELRALGYQDDAAGARSDAAGALARGRASADAANYDMLGTLLTAGARMYKPTGGK